MSAEILGLVRRHGHSILRAYRNSSCGPRETRFVGTIHMWPDPDIPWAGRRISGNWFVLVSCSGCCVLGGAALEEMTPLIGR